MIASELVRKLEACWELDTGFFGQLRQGRLNDAMFSELLATLDAIDFSESSFIPRRVASLLWYMPLFMGWQQEVVKENGLDCKFFEEATNKVQESVERILGLP